MFASTTHLLHKHHDKCKEAGHPIPPNLRLKLYKYVSREKRFLKERINDEKNDAQSTMEGSQVVGDSQDGRSLAHKRLSARMLLLEGLFLDLLGSKFRYRLGIQGPEFDIFLWNVLLNRKELAMEMWKHVKYPVRSAIVAAYLLRQLANDSNTDAIAKIKMRENADFFEDQATRVQKAADEDNRDFSVKTLDCTMFLFRDMSLLDVAVAGKSNRFLVTKCCVQASTSTETIARNHLFPLLSFPTFANSFPLVCNCPQTHAPL